MSEFDRLLVEATASVREDTEHDKTVRGHYVALTARLRSRDLLDDHTEQMAFGLSRAIADIEELHDLELRGQAHMEFFARVVISSREHDPEIVDIFLRYAKIDPADFDEAELTEYVTALVERMEHEQEMTDAAEEIMTGLLLARGIRYLTPQLSSFVEFFVNGSKLLLSGNAYTAADRQNQLDAFHSAIDKQHLPRALHRLVEMALTQLERALSTGPQA